MKLAVIIISQNQIASMPGMLKAVEKLTADRFWVLDRCTDDSEGWLRQHGETSIIVNTKGTGFLAGKARDLGLDAVLAADRQYDAVLFLDGDRIPCRPITMRSIRKSLRRFDVSLCSLEGDTRAVRPYKEFEDFSPNQFISCGFLAHMDCLETIRQLTFMKGRCFHEIFDGAYGYEDGYLGKLLRALEYSIGWSDIKLRGAIVFDDFQKMISLKSQLAKYELLYQQMGVEIGEQV